MSDYESRQPCSLVLDYVSGACTVEEAAAFERHLEGCPSCQIEVDELRVVWEAIPMDIDIIAPPVELKLQVMDAIFASDALAYNAGSIERTVAAIDEKAVDEHTSRRHQRKRLPTLRAIVVSLLILITASSIGWGLEQSNSKAADIPTLEDALTVSAAHIDQLIALKPAPDLLQEGTRTYGVACIVDNGSSKQFIVYVFGAKATQGDQAYQVWLVNDGRRRSAGTFRIDDSKRGIGVLSMPIASDQLAFDTIGITLEPDDDGDEPRGTKAFGSATS